MASIINILLALFVVAVKSATEHLTLTALLSNARGDLRFECWQIKPPFTQYPTVGQAVLDFASVSNISYVVLPAKSREDLHKPPHPMFFVLLSGLAHVSIPDRDYEEAELWIREGQMMVAADVVGEGHLTEYPGDTESHALQIPFKHGRFPEHVVLHRGVCRSVVEAQKHKQAVFLNGMIDEVPY